MISKLTDIQNVLESSGILTCFSGRFSQVLIEEIGDALKKHMENEERPKSDIFNVLRIFVEQSQNIRNYVNSKANSPVSERIACSAIIGIGRKENDYFIWSGNLVDNVDVEQLSAKLNIIVNAEKDELKKLYKAQMMKDIEPGQVGAGVGFFDIAKRARQPIEFSIGKVDEQFSFFEIKVIV
ncbi:SiaB family protein kinase [Candidatus Symbiobacter mobilis]|uniref:Uncharacterized protein n=1 Tax=Candidatus Symbiobacter mobilis CR TaxID=946483 RepID=U5N8P9_9BURK|nr:SiaB family protein kinase [Candidatus Symbiobacter mobilis]AGX87906.1 hypothetical protein Cenrod_1822 [Candidatus Symbiobacter mobilis CR]